MTIEGVVGIGLLIAGSFLGVPVAIVLGIVVLLFEVVRQIWSRRGLTNVQYSRHLGRDRLEWGDETSLTVSIWNRRRVPLAWLRADDQASAGVSVDERSLVVSFFVSSTTATLPVPNTDSSVRTYAGRKRPCW